MGGDRVTGASVLWTSLASPLRWLLPRQLPPPAPPGPRGYCPEGSAEPPLPRRRRHLPELPALRLQSHPRVNLARWVQRGPAPAQLQELREESTQQQGSWPARPMEDGTGRRRRKPLPLQKRFWQAGVFVKVAGLRSGG